MEEDEAKEVKTEIFLITGTTRGLGQKLAQYFLEKGKLVIGCGRSDATITHPYYHHFKVNLSQEEQVQHLVRIIKKDFRRIDVLVANAGIAKSSLFFSVTSGTLYQSFIENNLSSCFYICREISKLMVSARFGRIITMASIMTGLHEPGTAIYAATKAAVVEMTKIMARELAPMGITCNVVSPSLIQSDSAEKLGEDWAQRILNLQVLSVPLKANDVAQVIEFYADPKSWCITGQVIDMCYIR